MYQIKKKRKDQLFHGDLAHSLVQLVVMQISKTGSIEFSLRELAKKLGVSHAAAYRHFMEKQDLLDAIALEGYTKLGSLFQQTLEKEASQLESLGKTYIEFALQNPGYYRVMFGIKLDKNRNKNLHNASMQTFLFLLDAIGKRDKETVKKAVMIWSIVHGWVTLKMEGQITGLAEQFDSSESEIEAFIKNMISNSFT